MNDLARVRSYAEVRRRLFCPPNAVEDTGITMRNGWPQEREEPEEAPPSVPVPKPSEPIRIPWRNKKISPYVVPQQLRWSFVLGHEPKVPRPEKFVTPRHVLMAVAKVWDIHPSILTGSCRRYFAVAPRLVMMALAHRLTGRGGQYVGKCLSKDHSTILAATKLMGHHLDAVAAEMGDCKDPLAWAVAMKKRTGGVF